MQKIILALITGALLMSSNNATAKKTELKPAQVIIALGYGPAKNKKGQPKAELKRRVDKAVELYNKGLAPYIIFTGADTGAGCEAEVMRELAIREGVPAEKIILETKATDTITNAKYSVEIMRERGWTSAILVSNPYHLKRARDLFEASPGISVQLASAETPDNPFYHIFVFSYELTARAHNKLTHAKEKAKVEK